MSNRSLNVIGEKWMCSKRDWVCLHTTGCGRRKTGWGRRLNPKKVDEVSGKWMRPKKKVGVVEEEWVRSKVSGCVRREVTVVEEGVVEQQ